MKIVAAIFRFLQLLFAIIVLGLSISLIQTQSDSATPPQTRYAAFCGGWGILIGFIGAIAICVESVPTLIIAALDGLSAFLLLAAGIALAVALGVGNCNDEQYQQTNVIVRGAGEYDGEPYHTGLASLAGRCHQAQADTAFLFFGVVAFCASAVLVCLSNRRGKVTSHA